MALAKLPNIFGFNELKKVYFPHLYNRKEKQNVIRNTLPDIAYYNPDGMKPQDGDIFFLFGTMNTKTTSMTFRKSY